MDARTGVLKRKMGKNIKNRTFIFGLISSFLTIAYIFICIYVFFINKGNSNLITYLIRISIILILFSFITGLIGLIKAKKSLLGKILCIFSVSIFSIIVFLCLWAFYELTFPHKMSKKKDLERTSKLLELDLSDGKYIRRIENHSGFLGDGDYYAIIKFDTSNQIIESIKKNDNWKVSPLPKSLLYLLYDDEKNDNINFINDKRMVFPEPKNCYYYFFNRSDEFEKPNNRNPDFLLNWQYSYNFTVALFDLDNNIMYIYELDT